MKFPRHKSVPMLRPLTQVLKKEEEPKTAIATPKKRFSITDFLQESGLISQDKTKPQSNLELRRNR